MYIYRDVHIQSTYSITLLMEPSCTWSPVFTILFHHCTRCSTMDGPILHHTVPLCACSSKLYLFFHLILYTVSHSVPALPFYTCSPILYLLSHSVPAVPFCTCCPIMYLLSHSVPAVPFCTCCPTLYLLSHSIHAVPFCTYLHSTVPFCSLLVPVLHLDNMYGSLSLVMLVG